MTGFACIVNVNLCVLFADPASKYTYIRTRTHRAASVRSAAKLSGPTEDSETTLRPTKTKGRTRVRSAASGSTGKATC